jgi:hypothetical protein
MTTFTRCRYGFGRAARATALAGIVLAGPASLAHGQGVADPAVEQANRVRDRLGSETRFSLQLATRPEINGINRLQLGDVRFEAVTSRDIGARSSALQQPRSKKRAFAGGVVGAVAGFFGGAFLGAAIEGDRCNCDDPGFKGFWIGAPVGTAAGAILGSLFLF